MSNVLIRAVFISQQKPKKTEKERGKKTKKRHLRKKVVSEDESSDSARYGGKVFTPQNGNGPQRRGECFHTSKQRGISSHLSSEGDFSDANTVHHNIA